MDLCVAICSDHLLCRYWCWSDKRHLHLDGWSVLQEEARTGGDIPGGREWAGHIYHVPGTDECHDEDWVAPGSAGSYCSHLYNIHSWWVIRLILVKYYSRHLQDYFTDQQVSTTLKEGLYCT